MKRILSFLLALACTLTATAQTAEEILARMDAEMEKINVDNVSFVMDMKVPILGTITTKNWMYGDKFRTESKMFGETIIVYHDGTDTWTYNSKSNEIEITHDPTASTDKNDSEMDMLSGITDGYDVSIKKETEKAWHILCKKSASNKDKDDPKTMDVVVSKENYRPVSLSAKVSGVTATLRNFSFSVSESQVSFNPNEFPGAKIVDKR